MVRAWLLLNAILAGTVLAQAEPVGQSINALAVDLLHAKPGAENSVFSPYSIQLALGMAFAGAQGETRAQMAAALHYGQADSAPDFTSLNSQFDALARRSAKAAAIHREHGGSGDPITLTQANRIYGQTGFDFLPAYLSILRNQFHAPLETLDFGADPTLAARTINVWVAEQTRDRIRDLVSAGNFSRATRLVLVNAIYLKAPWAEPFEKSGTNPGLFRIANGAQSIRVPMMEQTTPLGYGRWKGLVAVTIPYSDADLQFLILLPDAPDGLAALEAKLTGGFLGQCADLPETNVRLWLPRFQLEPPAVSLNAALQKLGMPSAFDLPPGSANFHGIAKPEPGGELFISDVLHRAFIAVDEQGTEAAAATAVEMMAFGPAPEPPKPPLPVMVNRPFLFAIQHRPTGACLFLGRVVDPR